MSDIKTWKYHISSSEQFKEGELIALTDRGLDTLSFPDEFSSTTDDNGNVIIVYRKKDGSIWSVTFDKNQEDVLEHEQLLYVPSGSSNPSVAMDKDGKKIIAIEFLPAGSEQKEIWIYEPPYSGTGIRQIGYGEKPLLFTDHNGITHLFYQHISKEYICHRRNTDSFVAEICLLDTAGYYPLGIRQVDYPIAPPWYIQTRYILFFGDGEGLPRYFLSELVDRYVPEVVEITDQISLVAEIPDATWQGIEKVTVEITEELILSARTTVAWQGIEKATVEITDGLTLGTTVASTWIKIEKEVVEIEENLILTGEINSLLWVEVEE